MKENNKYKIRLEEINISEEEKKRRIGEVFNLLLADLNRRKKYE